jgi:Spy/CpxP family protein refolding chaperone
MAGILLTANTALRAQDTNAPAANPPANPTFQRSMRPLPGPGAPMGGPFSVLTEEQRTSYQKNMADKRAEMMELSTKRQAARQEITQVVLSPKLDENLIRQKFMDEAKIEADIAILQAKAFADIQPALTDEQIEKLKQPPAPMQMRPMQTPPPPTGTNHDANGLPPKP